MPAQRKDHVSRIRRHRFGAFLDRALLVDRHLQKSGIAFDIGNHIRAGAPHPDSLTYRAGDAGRFHAVQRGRNESFGSRIVNPHRTFVRIVQRVHFRRIGLLNAAKRRTLDRIDILIGQRSDHAEVFLSEPGIRADAHALFFRNDTHFDHRARQRISHRVGIRHLIRLISFNLCRSPRYQGAQRT